MFPISLRLVEIGDIVLCPRFGGWMTRKIDIALAGACLLRRRLRRSGFAQTGHANALPRRPLYRDPVFDGAADPVPHLERQGTGLVGLLHQPPGQRARRPGRRPLVPRHRHRHRLVGRRRPDLDLPRHGQGARVRAGPQHLLGALPRRARPDLPHVPRLRPGRPGRLERRPAHRPLHQPGPRRTGNSRRSSR